MKTSRVHGIDTARLLLIGGPIIHSAVIGHQNFVTNLTQTTSSFFRMAAFFAIAGYVVSLNPKTSQNRWLLTRARQLVVPLISISGLLIGLLFWNHYTYSANVDTTALYEGHLWFLYSLIIITPLTIILDRTRWSETITSFLDRHYQYFLIIVLAFASVIKIVEYKLHHDTGGHMVTLSVFDDVAIMKPLGFSVYYLLGFFLGRSKISLEYLNKNWIIGVGFIGLIISVIFFTHYHESDLTWSSKPAILRLVLLIMDIVTPVLMSLSILLIANRIKTVGPVTRYLSNASYTVYLFHMLFIYLLIPPILKMDPTIGIYPLWFTLMIGSTLLSLVVYEAIRISPLLAFLFNGKGFTMSFCLSTFKHHRYPSPVLRTCFVFIGYLPLQENGLTYSPPVHRLVFMRKMRTRRSLTHGAIWYVCKPYPVDSKIYVNVADTSNPKEA